MVVFNMEEKDKKDQLSEPTDIVFEETGETSNDFNPNWKKLKDKLKIKTKEAGENLAGWQRAKADYINLKNEFEKKTVQLLKFANQQIISDLLPILDSFALAFANKPAGEERLENWRHGIERIHGQLESILKNYGLKRLDALGKDFDPASHESVGWLETASQSEDHKILEVVKDGYELEGKIIRPAQVKIGQFKKAK